MRVPILLLMLHVSLWAGPAQAQGFDRLGAPVFEEPDLLARPSTPAPVGWLVRVSVADPVLAAHIREQRLYAHRASARLGLATQLARQGSDIHARTSVGAALQLHAVGSTWGLAVDLEQWSFAGGLERHRWRARLGWGHGFHRQVMLALQLRPQLAGHGRATVEFLLSSSFLSPFQLVFREQRVVGLPVTRQFGVVCGNAQVSVRAGFNSATMAGCNVFLKRLSYWSGLNIRVSLRSNKVGSGGAGNGEAL